MAEKSIDFICDGRATTVYIARGSRPTELRKTLANAFPSFSQNDKIIFQDATGKLTTPAAICWDPFTWRSPITLRQRSVSSSASATTTPVKRRRPVAASSSLSADSPVFVPSGAPRSAPPTVLKLDSARPRARKHSPFANNHEFDYAERVEDDSYRFQYDDDAREDDEVVDPDEDYEFVDVPSSPITVLRIAYRGSVRELALVPRMAVEELREVLSSVFAAGGGRTPIGFVHGQRVLMLEDVCHNPNIVSTDAAPLLLLCDEPDDNEVEEDEYDRQFYQPLPDGPDASAQAPTYPASSPIEVLIDEAEMNAITRIIHREDADVQAAYDACPDLSLLVDAFIRLARAWVHNTQAEDAEAPRTPLAGPDDLEMYDDEDEADNSREAEVARIEAEMDENSYKYNVILALYDEQMLTQEETAYLVYLIRAGDPAVAAAHVAYEASKDLEDFIDTLQHIVVHTKYAGEPLVSPSLGDYAASPDSNSNAQDADRVSDARASALDVPGGVGDESFQQDENPSFLDDNEYVRDLASLHTRGLVSHQDAIDLIALGKEGDPLVEAAFIAFAHNQDEEDLVHTLTRVLSKRRAQFDHLAEEEEEEEAMQMQMQMQQEEEEEEERQRYRQAQQEQPPQGGADDVDVETLTNALTNISRRPEVSAEVILAVINWLSAGDPTILAIFDTFKDLPDENDLVDSLLRVCRVRGVVESDAAPAAPSASAQPQAQADPEAAGSPDGVLEELQSVSLLHSTGHLSDDEAEILWGLVLRRDPATLTAFAEFREDTDFDKMFERLMSTCREQGVDEQGLLTAESSQQQQQQQQRQAQQQQQQAASDEQEQYETLAETAARATRTVPPEPEQGQPQPQPQAAQAQQPQAADASQFDHLQYSQVFENQVMDMFREQKLTRDECIILAELFGTGHSLVVSPFELFSLDNDLQNLRTNLEAVARSVKDVMKALNEETAATNGHPTEGSSSSSEEQVPDES